MHTNYFVESGVEKLVAFLSELTAKAKEGWERKIEVYSFDLLGFRISEISVSYHKEGTSHGYSYMRADPGCSEVILAAEDFIIYSMELDEAAAAQAV